MNEVIRPQFHDAEISKATDFGGLSEFPVELINILFDGIYKELTSSFVLGGLDVLEMTPLSMNVKVTPGVAYDRASKKTLVLSSDLIVSVPSCDPNLDRIDTLEIKYVEIDEDVEMRTFKDPANGSVATQSVPTKKKITIQGKCLAGTPGSGVAPNTEAGWVKIAEISVAAGAGSINTDSIELMSSEYGNVNNDAWTTEKQSTFRVGSPYWIKNIARNHANSSITNLTAVHGIRQGRNNGFDTDLVRGTTPTDNGLHLLSLAQYDLGWDSMLSVSPKIYTSKITWQNDWPYMNHEQTFYEGVPYRSISDNNTGHIPTDSLGSYWELVGGGSGAGNVGYNFTAGQMTNGVAGWTGYKDAAQSTPVDGTGGTVTAGHTFTKNTDTPIIGTADALWSKPASNCQGEGFSAPLTIDEGVRGGPAQVTFNFRTPATGYADGDTGVYIFDVTNGAVIIGSLADIPNTYGKAAQYSFNFVPSTSSQYRVCFHVKTTSATACSVRIANVQVGARTITQGAVVGEWMSYTPTITGLGSGGIASQSFKYRRVGTSMEINGQFIKDGTAGTGSDLVCLSAPSGFTIATAPTNENVGSVEILGLSPYIFNALIVSGTIAVRVGSGGLLGGGVVAGGIVAYKVSVPIAQWVGSGVGLVQGYEEYASNGDVSATASVTTSGYLQGFGNFGGFGAGWAVGTIWIRRGRFQNPIQWGRDDTYLYIRRKSTGEINRAPLSTGNIVEYSPISSVEYGFVIRPVSGDPYAFDLILLSGGRYPSAATYGSNGAPFSTLSSDYEWFVKKTSAGKPGETLPVIRAEYAGLATATSVVNDTAVTIKFGTKVEDTHSIYNTSTGEITIPYSGVYMFDAASLLLAGNSASQDSSANFLNITQGKYITRYFSFPANLTYADFSACMTMRCKAGDRIVYQISHKCGATRDLIGGATYTRLCVTLLGH